MGYPFNEPHGALFAVNYLYQFASDKGFF